MFVFYEVLIQMLGYRQLHNLQIDVEAVAPVTQKLDQVGFPLYRECKDTWYRADNVEVGQREFIVLDPASYTHSIHFRTETSAMTTKTAIVFAGGGSLGAVQVGMLRALVETNVRFDMVIGASVGAINGAYFAARPDSDGVQALAGFWRGLSKTDIFPLSWFDTCRGLIKRRGYLLQPSALNRLLGQALPIHRIEDAVLPLYIVTTNLLSGAETVLSSGELEQALLASAAIPLVFPCVQIADQFLVDGGVASNTPISTAVALGATNVVVIPTGVSCDLTQPPRGLVALALHTVNLMSMRQLVSDIEHFRTVTSLHIVPPLCPVDVSVFNFDQTESLLQRAYEQTLRWLERGGLERTKVPGALSIHSHAHEH
ncbi:NTE family protein RssA [compost metagenome]